MVTSTKNTKILKGVEIKMRLTKKVFIGLFLCISLLFSNTNVFASPCCPNPTISGYDVEVVYFDYEQIGRGGGLITLFMTGYTLGYIVDNIEIFVEISDSIGVVNSYTVDLNDEFGEYRGGYDRGFVLYHGFIGVSNIYSFTAEIVVNGEATGILIGN